MGGGGGLETAHRPVFIKPVYFVSTLQEENYGFHHTRASKRVLGNIIRFNRYLLPCYDTPEIQKVSLVLFRRENISVLGLLFCLCVSPSVFYGVLKTVLWHIHLQAIQVHAYLDDWIQRSALEGQSWHHIGQLMLTVLDQNWSQFRISISYGPIST